MRQFAPLLVTVSVLVLERPTRAEDPTSTSVDDVPPADHAPVGKGPKGLELGIRSGFALPFGNSDGTHAGYSGGPSDPLNTDIANMVPIWIDAGYRFIPRLFVGAYFTYGFGSVPSSAESSFSCNVEKGCSVRDLRLGADVQLHTRPASALDPWVGLGFGFEWLEGRWRGSTGGGLGSGSPPLGGLTTSDRDGGGSSGLSGWEFVNVQAGLDLRPGAWWGLGPFLMLSFAQFDHFSEPSRSLSIDRTALHEWFSFGVRGIFDPMSHSLP